MEESGIIPKRKTFLSETVVHNHEQTNVENNMTRKCSACNKKPYIVG